MNEIKWHDLPSKQANWSTSPEHRRYESQGSNRENGALDYSDITNWIYHLVQSKKISSSKQDSYHPNFIAYSHSTLPSISPLTKLFRYFVRSKNQGSWSRICFELDFLLFSTPILENILKSINGIGNENS